MFKLDRDKLREELMFSLSGLAIMYISAAVVMFFLFNIYIGSVNSGSMYPTMKTGDVSVLMRLRDKPERFDIVTAGREDMDFVLEKRIIGLPGETIEIIDGIVYVDGKELDDKYAYISNTTADPLSPRYMPARTIEEDHYFLLGDNRDYSSDSREMGDFHIDGIRYKLVNIVPVSKVKRSNEIY